VNSIIHNTTIESQNIRTCDAAELVVYSPIRIFWPLQKRFLLMEDIEGAVEHDKEMKMDEENGTWLF
jgi:hypothetical protein